MFIATLKCYTKVATILDISENMHAIPWKCIFFEGRCVVLKSEDILNHNSTTIYMCNLESVI